MNEGGFNELKASRRVDQQFYRVCVHLDIAMKHMYNGTGDEEKPNCGVDGDGKNWQKEE